MGAKRRTFQKDVLYSERDETIVTIGPMGSRHKVSVSHFSVASSESKQLDRPRARMVVNIPCRNLGKDLPQLITILLSPHPVPGMSHQLLDMVFDVAARQGQESDRKGINALASEFICTGIAVNAHMARYPAESKCFVSRDNKVLDVQNDRVRGA